MTDLERFNQEFSDRHQAMRWMVRLSFALIILMDVTVIVTAVLKREANRSRLTDFKKGRSQDRTL